MNQNHLCRKYLLYKPIQKFEEDAVSPPSSPTPGLKIIQGKFKKRKQTGKPTSYKRRTPKQSELKNLNSSKLYLHNFIRMLSDPYPNAFIKIGKKKIIFKSSKYDGKTLAIEGVIE